MTNTRELDRLLAAREDGHSDEIGEFIDWLRQNGYVIARWEHETYQIEPSLVVYDQEKPETHNIAAPFHRTVGRLENAICGARPKPWTVHGREYRSDGWFGRIENRRPVVHDPTVWCAECQRMYEAREWPERQSEEPHLIPARVSIEQLLAQYFNVDLNKVEQERQTILRELTS